jgi:hypothetical protein
MSDPYFNGLPWKEDTAYAAGDQVTYNGYRYEAMTATNAGDKPNEATYGATFSALTVPFDDSVDPPVPFPQQTLTMRKWKVWDYPAGYIMARVLGIPGDAEIGYPNEIRLVQVRTEYQYNGDPTADIYHQPSSASYSGYGMPGGMDSNWAPPDFWDMIVAPSAAMYQDGAPRAYSYNLGTATGIIFNPTTIATFILNDFNTVTEKNESYMAPAWASETQGQMISSYQTFSRDFYYTTSAPPDYNFSDNTTPSFMDNWQAERNWTGYLAGEILGVQYTLPDYKDS